MELKETQKKRIDMKLDKTNFNYIKVNITKVST